MSKSIALPDLSHSVTERMPRAASQLARRLMALALAIAVPAFAAPSEWRELPLFETAQAVPLAPMGFETAGESFPGSAFYYLADEPYLPIASDTPARAAVLDEAADEIALNPAARSMVPGGSGQDKARALKCMTMAIYYEAATESDAGQRAVAQVVLNRVAHPAYPNNVCGVVFQGSERTTGCQFSFTCDGSLARTPSRQFWDRAQRVAMAALAGAVYKPVGLATHYHTTQIHPYWADSLSSITTIGAHIFYRWKGAAGLPAAFSSAYAGAEPLPAPRPRAADPAPVADPVELARAYEATLAVSGTVPQAPRNAASPASGVRQSYAPPAYSAEIEARGGDALYSGGNLPGSGQVKSEYAQSGQWIAQP